MTLLDPMDSLIGVSHYLDCNSTTTSLSHLRWEREGGDQRFPTEDIPGIGLRLDFAPRTGQDLRPIVSSDLGVYVCVDTTTDERLSVTVTDGTYV